jgi:hypothetical protein
MKSNENLMKNQAISERSLLELVADLRHEAKELIRQEIELAKTELTEKATQFGRNAAWLAIGGFVAYAGLIIFLLSLGFLISFGLQSLNLHPALANAIGIAVIGLGAAGAGYALLAKALKSFSTESLAPQKTLHSLQEIRGTEEIEKPARHRPAAARPSSAEMESLIGSTQRMVKETASELRQRFTVRYMSRQCVAQVKKHPWLASLVAAGTSFAGAFLVRRRLYHGRAY